MRLRQIALVARDLEAAKADVVALLGLGPDYADPGVGKYGLSNAVWPIGHTFLEVVSPKQAGTTAGRLLDKRGGDGGYMVILQVEDMKAARALATAKGVRFADTFDGDGFGFTHLHPKDVGGAILSVDEMDPYDRWEWGGPDWRSNVRTDVSSLIVAADLQAEDPGAMARRWAEVLGRTAEGQGEAWTIRLEAGEIRFGPIRDGRGEGLGGFEVAVSDPEALRRVAETRGLTDGEGRITLCGTRLALRAAAA